MAFIFFCLLLSLAGVQAPNAPAQATAPSTAAIRGKVIAGDTGQPLRRALIRLNQVDTPTRKTSAGFENRATTTDAEGAYEFLNLPTGRYLLEASSGAYLPMTWGEQAPRAPGKPLDVVTGGTLEHVDFTMVRGGVVAGRIVDEFGEPVSGLLVTAMRAQTVGGRRQLMSAGTGTTNDIGEFRIFNLASGQYYVQALWRRMGPGDPTSPDRTGYPVTYFPGTTNEAEAQRFTVAAGQTIGELAMALSSITTARVGGVVVNTDGRPMGNAFIEVLSTIGGSNMLGAGQPVQPDGTFTFASVAPGEYVFRAQSPASRNAATLQLTVGADDVIGLRLVALPPAVVTGRIVVDSSTTPPAAAFSLMASPDQQWMPGGSTSAVVAADLTFELTATPGRNRLTALNLPPGWTMRSVRVHSVDVIDDGIELKPGERVTGVEIELTNRIATLAGQVTNARGEPAKDYTLVMFPADSKRWKPNTRYLRTARPDRDGRFNVSNVVPADYYVIAIDKVEPGRWYELEFLERVRSKATSVNIGEGESKTVDLKLTTGS
jgi:hypothetical protein